MRGLGEDLDLHSWASCCIWPLEVAFEGDDGYVAAKLAMAEMLKSGTTCFLEPMLPASAGFERICQAVDEVGIRACLGKLVKVPKSDPDAGISDARDAQTNLMSIEMAVEAHKRHHGSCDGRLNVWLAAETPRGQDEAGFKAIAAASREHGMRFTMHVAEDARDAVMTTKAYGASPGKFIENIGAASPNTVIGHMIHVDPKEDIELLARTGTHVAHNPTSNAKLGDGIALVPEMLAAGVNVCLGTDGAPCSNTHDLFRGMHLAALIHKGRRQDAAIMSAEQVLEMATINGARALGLETEIGSLEVGKKADFAVVDPGGLHCAPWDAEAVGNGGVHPATIVVHSCSGRDVDMVVVGGKTVVQDGKLATVDKTEIVTAARDTISRLRQRSGVGAQPLKLDWHYEQ